MIGTAVLDFVKDSSDNYIPNNTVTKQNIKFLLQTYRQVGARIFNFNLPAEIMEDVLDVAHTLNMTNENFMLNDDDETVRIAMNNAGAAPKNNFYKYVL